MGGEGLGGGEGEGMGEGGEREGVEIAEEVGRGEK